MAGSRVVEFVEPRRFSGAVMLLCVACCLGALLGAPVVAGANPPGDEVPALEPDERIPGAYIVVLKDSVAHPDSVAEAQTEQRDGELGLVYRSALKGYSVEELSRRDVASLRRDPRVAYVEPDGLVEAPAQTTPFGIERIFAPENEALDIDGVDDVRIDVDIAGIDSGIDIEHPDLNVFARTNCVPAGESGGFTGCVDNSGVPGNSHGTHAAGTIAAIDNGFGVVGAAPGARLWAVRVLANNNAGAWSWVIGGLDWVTARSDQIEVAHLNVSGEKMESVDSAIAEAVEEGIVVVTAAGNNRVDTISKSPASSPDAITTSGLADYNGKPGGGAGVGAGCSSGQGIDDHPYYWTNWGAAVDIVAPGVCVYSTTLGGAYGSFNGTSFAGPHVAGAAALLASESNPESKADVEAIREELIDSGSLAWTDTSEDGHVEPVLHLGEPLTETEAATGAATVIDGGSVRLNGAFNPRGLESEYWFEYGPTTAYGQSFPVAAKEVGAGTEYTEVSETVDGLIPDQLYHYRLVVSNGSGTFHGEDRTVLPARWDMRFATEPSAPEQAWLAGVDCPTKSSCVAVGRYAPNSGKAYSYEGSGGNWTVHEVPDPAEGSIEALQDVSCSSAKDCIAVGDGEINGNIMPQAARWNGSAWTPLAVPGWFEVEQHKFAELDGVSCVSANWCMAAGWYRNSEGKGRNYSAVWNGSAWTKLSTPNPSSLEKSVLEDVSCTAVDFCMAVGWYNPLVGATKKVTLAWDGSVWTEVPAGSSSGGFSGVDCTSPGHCMASASSGVASWDGSAWSVETLPLPDGANGYELEGVACASPSYCVAVGSYYQEANGMRLTLAEAWNGVSWTVQGTSRPSHSSVSVLGGVTCTAPAKCVAVGWNWATGKRQPLIETLSSSPVYQYAFGTNGSGNGQFKYPRGMAVDAAGNLWVTDRDNNRVQKFNSKGEYLSQFGTAGSGNGQLSKPNDVAIDAAGNLWVVDGGNYRVQKFNSKGEYLTQFGSFGSGNGQFKEPAGIAIGANGDVWVSDIHLSRLARFNAAGEFVQTVGSAGSGNGQFHFPHGIAVDAAGNLWVADRANHRVQKLSATGQYLGQFGTEGKTEGKLELPAVLDIQPSGDLLVGDRFSGRVQEFAPDGRYLGQLSGATITEPGGIAIGANGAIFVSMAHLVRKWVEPAAPLISGETATEVGIEGAVLNAYVTPGGSETTFRFEYGPTTAYGSEVPLGGEGLGSGYEAVNVGKSISDLKRATTYHYRVVATNDLGTTVGGDRTFTTSAPAPLYQFSFGASGSGNGQFKRSQGMAIDAAGNVWVADSENNRVQKFNSKGEYLSQFGTSGTGNGQLKTPSDVAIDKEGNLWVVDRGNDRVQKFSPNGEYLAKFGSSGTGGGQFSDPWGVAVAPNGNIWVTDFTFYRVSEFTPAGEFVRRVGGTGSALGKFSSPQGIVVDSEGYVWVVDRGNNRVQKLSSSGEALSAFGSEGETDGKFKSPTVIDILPSGALLVADRWTGRVQQFSAQGQYVGQFGKGQLTEPEGIAVNSDGVIYVAHSWGNAVKKWVEPGRPSISGETASSIGEKAATLEGSVNPHGLSTTYQFEYGKTTAYGSKAPVSAKSIGSGSEWVKVSEALELKAAATYHYRLTATNAMGTTQTADRVFTTPFATPTLESSFGASGSGNGQFSRPMGMAVDAAGNLWVTDRDNNRVQKFNSKGEYLSQLGSAGTGNGQFSKPSDIAVTGGGDLWVVDSGNNRVQKFNSKGEYLAQFGSFGTGNGQFKEAAGIAIGPNGHIWVSDRSAGRLAEFNAGGEFVKHVGTFGIVVGKLRTPQGIAVDEEGDVWVADGLGNRVQEYSAAGEFLGFFGSQGETDGKFKNPTALELLPSGGLLVADRSTGRVQVITSAGVYVTQFGKGQHSEAEGLALAPDGTIYVASSAGNSIKKWDGP